jgi:hypothetical protein
MPIVIREPETRARRNQEIIKQVETREKSGLVGLVIAV